MLGIAVCQWGSLLAILALVAAAGPDKPSESPQDRVKKDIERLEGNWQLATTEHKGDKTQSDQDSPVVFKDGRIFDKGDEVGTFKIEAGTEFNIIDITLIQADRTLEGIYTLEDDEFRICVFAGEGAKERPSKFTSEGEFAIFTFKRQP
jgi:uncharacterized protein (TIGR03067 family)